MKRIMIILFLLTSAVGYASYCGGPCICTCKCDCHKGVEECHEYCWECAHKHHGDCECHCHDKDCPNGTTYEERNYVSRRWFCSECDGFHLSRENSTDYGMEKGRLPKKRPYLHPIRHYNGYYFSNGEFCENP